MYAKSFQTPYNVLPITLVNKAVRQKVYRPIHCIECGLPLAEITDKVVVLYDGSTAIEKLLPDSIGIIDLRCDRRNCNQYYRMEFAL